MRAIGLVLLAACGATPLKTSEPPAPEPSRARLVTEINGLSGLTSYRGELFAVAERGGALLRWSRPDDISEIRIAGFPEDHDFEALTSLDDGTLAVGTETSGPAWSSTDGQSRALVLFVALEHGAARVIRTAAVPFAIWQIAPDENQGIEGICHADGKLVVGLETVKVQDGARLAPLARANLGSLISWAPFYLELSTDTGRLAGLECAQVGKDFVIYAIERHFGVAKVLRYVVPPGPLASPLEPHVIADLSAFVERHGLNLEGITVTNDGRVWLVVDNQWHTVSGPSEVLSIEIAK